MISIIPSLASADQLDLKNQLDLLGEVGNVHLDIEDGNFVPNITFGLKTVQSAAAYTSRALDAHLMVTKPELYIGPLLSAGIRKIAFHIESDMYPGQYLSQIRDANASAGLALNCGASVDRVLPYVDELDYILVMTSEPDGRGQRFLPTMLEKIRRARSALPDRVSIMADGGLTEAVLPDVVRAGADTLILGRAIWEGGAPENAYHRLMRLADGC